MPREQQSRKKAGRIESNGTRRTTATLLILSSNETTGIPFRVINLPQKGDSAP